MNERSLFLAALDISDPGERSAYLARACAKDEALRARVEVLLRSHRDVGSYLGTPALAQGDRTEAMGDTGPRPPDPDETQAGPATAGSSRDDALRFLAPGRQPGSLGRLAHYEVQEVLGQGGFGTVLKAFDEKLHRVVAIKVLAPALAANGTARQRFVRESRMAAAVRHEHIVVIHAVDDDPLPYLVMECIVGLTLQEKIDRGGPMEVKEILRIGHQVAAGLAAAHAQGLVHRDIKPANILLENGIERVKITDFGLARAADDASLTQSGVIAGTPMFMAPEQALGEAVDHRADLFSLGSMLYVLCTGRPPFRAASTLAVLKRMCEDTPRPVSELNPEVPGWLEAVVARLMAKKPEDRFASAQEVADLLGDGLADLRGGGRVRPAVPPTKPARPEGGRGGARRGRRWALAAGFVVVVAMSVGGTLLYRALNRDGAPGDPPAVAAANPPPPAVAPFDAAQAKIHQEAWARHLGVDVAVTNSIGMKLRLIPPGEFTMGYSKEQIDSLVPKIPEESHRNANQGTTAKSALIQEPYYLGSHEVTLGQFRRFVAETNYRTSGESDGKGGLVWDIAQNKFVHQPHLIWNHSLPWTREDGPVVFVSREDAEAFCGWLSDLEGRHYGLPTETQWEFACRAGTTTPWWTGDSESELLARERFHGPPARVGSLAANPFGLYDMHGNVSEWVPDAGQFGKRGGWTDGGSVHFGHSAVRLYGPAGSSGINAIGFRVAITGDLKAQTPKAVRPAAATPAFAVLAGDAKTERTFAGLAEAVVAARSGDTIEIRGDGPFETPPLDLGAKALVIRAGEGHRPVLRLDVRRPTKGKALLTNRAPLILEGVELQRLVDPADEEHRHTVMQTVGPLRMANVRIIQTGAGAALAVQSPNSAKHGPTEVVNSQMNTTWSAIDVWGNEADEALTVRNSIFHGCAGVHVVTRYHPSKKKSVRLERNTFAGLAAVGVSFKGPGDWLKPGRAAKLVSIEASDNLLASRCALTATLYEDTTLTTGGQAEESLRNLVGWSEDGNLYPSRNLLESKPDVGPDRHTYEDWRKFWKLTTPACLTGAAVFDRADPDDLINRPTTEMRKGLMPADFRLAEGSPGKGKGEGGRDLGADVDLVGPGPAYERWKKTPEYQQWLARTKEFLAGK